MAKLHSKPYPGNWEKLPGEDFKAYLSRSDTLFDAIPADKVVSFPYADGHAHYYVFSTKPLVLQSIPYLDAWQVSAAMIRGLRLSDIEIETARRNKLRSMFSDR